ncbi:MAG: nicotinate (nicotinamide) nucleotide adenylyltransferase [Marinilabiliales bacterium]|nr:MAG: nicotinate (nicotinamide) nucleotide adenylyltransferase [Marinilabiliales bacterium]
MHKAWFFGSFNPIHSGHLNIAEYIISEDIADEVIFIVSPQSPFKQDFSMLDDDLRYELVCLAVEDKRGLSASKMEFDLPKPSFTAKTLQLIRKKFPEDKHSVLLGSDQVAHFDQWQRYSEILQHHEVLLYPRHGIENPGIEQFPGMKLLDAPVYDIASTEIRNKIRNNEPVEDMLPLRVLKRIFNEGYYRK